MRVVMEVMIKPQGQIDHKGDFGDDLGAAETGDEVTNIAVVLLDGERQVFAGEELIRNPLASDASPVEADVTLEFGRFRLRLRQRQLLADGVPIKLGTRDPEPSSRSCGDNREIL